MLRRYIKADSKIKFKLCLACKKNKNREKCFARKKARNKHGDLVIYFESRCRKCNNKKALSYQRKKNMMIRNDPEMYKDFLHKHGITNRKSRNAGVRNLTNRYICQALEIPYKEFKRHPKMYAEIINAKREQLKLYRQLNPNHKKIKHE